MEKMSDGKTKHAFLTTFHMKRHTADERGFWVKGSGLVYVSKDRANEIPKVIEEHHRLEAERNLLLLLRVRGY